MGKAEKTNLPEIATEKGDTHYTSMTGVELHLSPSIVKKFLVSGDADKVTAQEVIMFIAMCKHQKLNPFLREAYLIKYGNQAATFVTGKETFVKRAAKNPKYKGHKVGTIEDAGKLTGAWAEVFVEGFENPIRVEVDYDEYVGKKSDGTITKMWKSKPKTMLKKVALVQALREAFPEDFGGMYSPEEINDIQGELPEKEVDVSAVYVSDDQMEAMNLIIEEKGVDYQLFLTYMRVESIADILDSDYEKAISALGAIEGAK